MSLIFLDQISDSDSVGGKAASLAKLLKGGFNVPAGFVVTDSEVSQPELDAAWNQLDAQFVVVRSSANVEDSGKNSFAGQFTTYLNVEQQLLHGAIQKCFAQANNEHVQAYAMNRGVELTDVQMNVIVQKMVNVQFGGVSFTKNPVTDNQQEVVIELVAGHGEGVASGGGQTQTVILDKQSGAQVTTYGAQVLDITPTQMQQVLEAVKGVEQLYGQPVDVEWSIDFDDVLWILQTRPITT